MQKIIFIISVSIILTLAKNSKLEYTAETLEGFKNSSGQGRKLIGEVDLWQDDIFIECDSAIYFFDKNIAELMGNVRIYQDSLTVFSERMIYDGNSRVTRSPKNIKIIDQETILKGNKGTYNSIERKAVFTGDVVIDDDTSRIFCDRLIHYRIDEVSYAYGEVFLWGKNESVYLSADTIENYGSAKLTYAYAKPKLYKIDTSYTISSNTISEESRTFSLDTMTVKAKRMEAVREPTHKKFYFFGDVEIFRESVQGKSDTIIYHQTEERTELNGSPIIFYGDSQLSGDSISISMKGSKLRYIKAVDQSISVSLEDTIYTLRKNQISGDTIQISFDENKVEGIFSRGDSKMLYFMFNEEKSPDGVNVFSSEGLDILFTNDEASDVNLFKGEAGGASPEGQTLPEFMTYGREEELYLPRFKWDTVRPKMEKLDYPNKNIDK